jgi:hypothetical protein
MMWTKNNYRSNSMPAHLSRGPYAYLTAPWSPPSVATVQALATAERRSDRRTLLWDMAGIPSAERGSQASGWQGRIQLQRHGNQRHPFPAAWFRVLFIVRAWFRRAGVRGGMLRVATERAPGRLLGP